MSARKTDPERDDRAMVIAGFDTPKFDFLCAADTREQAIGLMRRAWRVHCDRTGADPAYFNTDDVWTVELAPGQALRDGTRIL